MEIQELLDHQCRELIRDGCSPSRIAEILDGAHVRFVHSLYDQPLRTRLMSMSDESLLTSLLPFLSEIKNHPTECDELLSILSAKVTQMLQEKPWIINSSNRAQAFFRTLESLIFLTSEEQIRLAITSLLRRAQENQSYGGIADFSYFAALYYQKVVELFPKDQELHSLLLDVFRRNNNHVPLLSFIPPSGLPPDISERPFGEMKDHETVPFFMQDEILNFSDMIIPTRRADRHFTSCAPQAEANHCELSMNPSRSNERTFLFHKDRFLGSLKHSHTDHGNMKSFLAARTVFDEKTQAYPLIEGGIYLVASGSVLQSVVASTPRYDINAPLQLMPQRHVQGMFRMNQSQYINCIRSWRKEVEGANA